VLLSDAACSERRPQRYGGFAHVLRDRGAL
jgi:hypothetical protein